MRGKPWICLCDELLVEVLFTPAGFVASRKQDRLSIRIEGEGGPPFAIRSFKPQFLHIGVLRAIERIRMRPLQLRPILG